MAYDGSLLFETLLDTFGFNKGVKEINKLSGNLTSTFKNVGASIASAFAVQKLVEFGRQSVSLASDLQEVQNVVDVSFGEMSYKMEQFAETAIEAFGLSQLEAKRTGSSFMAMASGMQFAQDTASDMSLSLTALSSDMASFYNVKQSETKTALSAIFTGETEALKRYGILITEVNLQEYARQRGITKSINAMTQQEKVLLRYNYVMNAAKLAQGDFARTRDSWANQTRLLNENWKELCVTLGQVLIPVLSKAIPYVTAFVRILNDGLLALAKLWGLELPDYSSQAKGLDTIDTGLKHVSADAAKAKKSLQNLAGFDELNIIGKKAGETGGTAGSVDIGGGGSNLGLEVPKFDASGIKKQSEEIYNQMKAFLLEVGKKLQQLMPLIKTVAASIAAIWTVGKIADFIKWIGKVIKAIGGLKLVKGISKLVNAFMLGFDTAFGAGAGTFKSLTAGAKAFKKALSPLAKVMLTVGASVASFLITKNVFKDVAEGTRSWGSALAITIPLVGGLAVAIGFLVNPIAGIIVAIVGLVGAFAGLNEGQEKLLKQDVATYFTTGEISISQVADSVSKLGEELTATESKFLTNIEGLESSKASTEGLSDQLTILIGDLAGTGTITQQETEKMKNAFSDLATASKQYIQDSNDNMKLYLMSNRKMLEAQGVDVNNLINTINSGTANSLKNVDDIQARINQLTSKGGLSDIEITELSSLQEQLLKMSGIAVDSSETVNKLKTELSGFATIKFADTKEGIMQATDSINSIVVSAGKAYDELKKTKEEMLKQVSTMDIPQEKKEDLTQTITSMFTIKEDEIISAIAPIYQNVESQYSLLVSKIQAKTASEYNTIGNHVMENWKDWWSGISADEAIRRKARELGAIPVEELRTGAKVELQKGDLSADVMDKLLDFDTTGAKSKGVDIGKNIVEGEQKGITDNSMLAADAIKTATDKVIGTAKTELDVHSPSRVFFDIGMNLMQGLANGIAENMHIASKELQNLFDDMLKKLDSVETEFQRRIRSLFQSTAQSANSFTVGADGKVTYKEPKVFSAPIPRLATGTVIPARMGEFLAILGDNRREAEVVSPLSTIKQAVLEANAQNSGQNGVYVIHTHVHLNGREIGEAVEEFNARELIRGNGRRR